MLILYRMSSRCGDPRPAPPRSRYFGCTLRVQMLEKRFVLGYSLDRVHPDDTVLDPDRHSVSHERYVQSKVLEHR